MRISRRPSLPGATGAGDTGAIAPSALTSPKAAESSADDQVHLSDAARLRQRLRADLGDLERVDTARVADLRAQVATATYRPEPQAVAKSLVGELAADLLG